MWDLYRETDGGSIQEESNQGLIQGDVRLTQEEQVWDVYRGNEPSIQKEPMRHLYREIDVGCIQREMRLYYRGKR